MYRSTVVSLVLAVVVTTAPLSSHSRLLQPAARTSPDAGTQAILDDGGLNFDGPCGNPADIPPGAVTATWAAGSDQTVVLHHRVFHGGESYQFLVSFDGGATFDEVEPPQVPEGGAISYQVGGVPSAGDGTITIRIGLPTGAGPAVLRYTDGEYFSCADILLQGDEMLFSDGFETGDTTMWAAPSP